MHKNNFNIVRLILATLVLFSHSVELLDGNRSRELLTRIFGSISFGELAVDGFFILSGYLIFKSWVNQPCWKRFLLRRILRIYPGFIVASILSVLILGPIASQNFLSEISIGEFVSGLFVLKLKVSSLSFSKISVPYPIINGSFWTIPWEFRCYLLVLLMGVLGVFNHRKLTSSSIALIFIAFIVTSISGLFIQVIPKIGFAGRLFGMFSVGMACYQFKDKISFSNRGALLAGILMIAALFAPHLSEVFLALPFCYLIFWFGFKDISSLAWFRKMPDISYGTYLYGWPIIMTIIYGLGIKNPIFVTILSVISSYTFGYLSWVFVEKKWMSIKLDQISLRKPLLDEH